jgi:hypothetical protein
MIRGAFPCCKQAISSPWIPFQRSQIARVNKRRLTRGEAGHPNLLNWLGCGRCPARGPCPRTAAVGVLLNPVYWANIQRSSSVVCRCIACIRHLALRCNDIQRKNS